MIPIIKEIIAMIKAIMAIIVHGEKEAIAKISMAVDSVESKVEEIVAEVKKEV